MLTHALATGGKDTAAIHAHQQSRQRLTTSLPLLMSARRRPRPTVETSELDEVCQFLVAIWALSPGCGGLAELNLIVAGICQTSRICARARSFPGPSATFSTKGRFV